MKHVYASSALTIVAASAKSVFEGFLHPRVHSEPSHTIPVRIKPGVFGTMSINELDAACYDERFEPIAKRAWTMQEQLLAQRTLTFTTHTMMWTCNAGTKNFGNSLYFPHDLDSGFNDNDAKYSLNLSTLLPKEEAHLNSDKALSCWLRLVMAYSLRTASHERDKLNALAGVASHPSFSGALGPKYFAGLWEYGLARQLVWRTSERHRTLSDDEIFVYYRPMEYRAPSWSWASLEGGVIHFDFLFEDDEDENYEVVCDIVDCSTTPALTSANPLGEVVSGHLKLKAALRRAWFDPSTSNIYVLPSSMSPRSTIEFPYNEETITIAEASTKHLNDFTAKHRDVDLNEEPEATHGTDYRNMCGRHDETGEHNPIMIFCAAVTTGPGQVNSVNGLILVPCEVEGEINIFRRIGSFNRGRNEDFGSEMKREICII